MKKTAANTPFLARIKEEVCALTYSKILEAYNRDEEEGIRLGLSIFSVFARWIKFQYFVKGIAATPSSAGYMTDEYIAEVSPLPIPRNAGPCFPSIVACQTPIRGIVETLVTYRFSVVNFGASFVIFNAYTDDTTIETFRIFLREDIDKCFLTCLSRFDIEQEEYSAGFPGRPIIAGKLSPAPGFHYGEKAY
jgi:hypothetical protein